MAVKQSMWLAADRVLRAVGQFVLVGVLARNLGVTDFGLLSWAQALAAVAGLIGWSAADTALIRWWVRDPDLASSRLWVVYRIQWLFIGIGALGLALYAAPSEHWLLAAVVGLSLVGRSAEVFRFWHEAHLTSPQYIRWEQGIYWTFLVLKLVAAPFGLMHVAFVVGLEGLVLAVIMGYRHREFRVPHSVQPAWDVARAHWPLFVAYLLGLGSLRLPQLWLESVAGPAEVAYYSAAARLVEPWAFVPWALISPLFVRYVRASDANSARTLHRQMLALALGSGALLASIIALGSTQWLNLVYGPEFSAAEPALKALAFTMLPQFAMLVGLRRSVHLGRSWMVAAQGITQFVLLYLLLGNLGAKVHDATYAAQSALIASCLSVFGLFWSLSLRSPSQKVTSSH